MTDHPPRYWLPDPALKLSDTSLELVRSEFNPSGIDAVTKLKLMAAALITMAEEIRGSIPTSARHCALGITAIEDGAMWLVKAATTPVPKPKS